MKKLFTHKIGSRKSLEEYHITHNIRRPSILPKKNQKRKRFSDEIEYVI
jgi:hypothetical protein